MPSAWHGKRPRRKAAASRDVGTTTGQSCDVGVLPQLKEPLCDGAWAGSRWRASRLPMLAQRHEELCYEACCAVALAFAFLMSCAKRDLVRAAALG